MTDHATKTACSARSCGNRCRSGFTLVEVLVVTVIMAILLALVSTAVFPALQSAKEFAITSEAGQLGMAIDAFKSHYGSGYPPADLAEPASDGVDPLYNFVRDVFPRFQYDPSSADPANPDPLTATNLRNHLQNLKNEDGDVEGVYITSFDPGQSLVFWLVGFSNDPADPFDGHVARMRGKNLEKAFYAFDPDRLGTHTDEDGIWTVHYYPETVKNMNSDEANATGGSLSFLYFDKRAYDKSYDPNGPDGGGSLPPFSAYQESGGTNPFYNPAGFQIISSGLDKQLGEGGICSQPMTGADADNIANFSGGTIADYTDE